MVSGAVDSSGRLGGHDGDGRGECALQRADRNMVELLQELRVAQTGVQILFAFLLALSFTERFGRIDTVQMSTYVVTLLLSVITAGLLVAPVAVHRVTFQCGVKAETVQLGHRLVTVGLGALALTLMGAVLLVLDVAVGRMFAALATAMLGVVLVGLWFGLAIRLIQRARAAGCDDPALPPGESEDFGAARDGGTVSGKATTADPTRLISVRTAGSAEERERGA